MMHAGGICLTFLASICVSSSTETLYISYEDQRGSTGMIAGSAEQDWANWAMLSDSKNVSRIHHFEAFLFLLLHWTRIQYDTVYRVQ